jgi:hypothetical protein
VSAASCSTFGAVNDSVSVTLAPGAIDVAAVALNGDEAPDANE